MKRITKLSPSILEGMTFEMPFFNAVKQMYRCIEVKEMPHAPDQKVYKISFDWVVSNYSVPKKIEMDLVISDMKANALLIVNEITQNGSKSVITETLWEKHKLNTLSRLKEVFKTTAIEKIK